VRAAYALNDPLIARKGAGRGVKGEMAPLVACDAPNVIIETVKWAEDGNGIIVRLYDTLRRRGPITLTTSFPLKAAVRTNLLEEEKYPLTVEGNRVRYNIRPFEIVTLRLIPA
jgi:alpha-mannosidase